MRRTIRAVAAMFRTAVLAPNAPRRAPKARLELEQFESREVPAALTWTNAFGNNNFFTPSNWVLTGTSVTAQDIPAPGDDLTFDGAVSSANCVNFSATDASDEGPAEGEPGEGSSGSGGADGYNSFSLINGYAGTVSLVTAITTGTFTLSAAATGSIAQSYSCFGNTLTVTDTFTWTSGTLNSSTNLSTVTLNGATGLIAPTGGGTVQLGSNIELSGGAHATATEGTLSVTNSGVEFNIHANSSVLVNAGDNKKFKYQISSDNVVIAPVMGIYADGRLEVLSGTFYTGAESKVTNSGGELKINAGAEAYFTGADQEYGYGQRSGTLAIWNGGKLKSDNSVVIGGGKLVTLSDDSLAGSVTITCSTLVVDGGDVLLARDVTNYSRHAPYAFGTLSVTGFVVWTRGTYQPFVSAEQNGGPADLWQATGEFTVGGNNKIPTLAPVVMDYEGSLVAPTPGYRWSVLKSQQQITLSNNGAPALDTTVWKLDPTGQPVDTWSIIAKAPN